MSVIVAVSAVLGRWGNVWAEDDRLAQLEDVADRIWSLVVASHAVPDNGRATLMSRHALFGQAMVERARTRGCPDPEQAAWLARMALRPMATIHELDAAYDVNTGIGYGDACALSGDTPRARRTWQTILRRLQRARPDLTAAHAAVRKRIETGTVPPS
jgi:hypothetical protein